MPDHPGLLNLLRGSAEDADTGPGHGWGTVSRMSGRRLLGACAVAAALVTGGGCGDTGATAGRPDSARSVVAPSATATAEVTDLSLEQLRRTVLDAVRAETSVHESIGNLNAPAVTVVQDYSEPEGDLEAAFEVEPGKPPAIVGRRVDGEVYLSVDGQHYERVPPDKLSEAGSTPLVALFRTNVVEDLTTVFAAAVKGEFDGEDPAVGPGVTRYRLTIDTTGWVGAPGSARLLGIPPQAALPKDMPMTLWIGGRGLPVRVELKYAEPLKGITGTGTLRIDYSHWSDPVRIARPTS